MRGRGGGSRGQINFDFAVGVSIVVVTLVIAFSFIPSMFGGVTQNQEQSDKVVADRISEWAVNEGLADTDSPRELSIHCTNSFFSPSFTLTHCGFASDDIEDNLPLEYDRFVNISIQRGGDIYCWRGPNWKTGNPADATTATGCVGDYAAGSTPPQGSDVAVSRRAAKLGDRNIIVVVRVW